MADLLTVNEAAELLRVAPITVRRHIAAGRLPAVKVGNRVRVRKEALDQLLCPIDLQAPRRPGARGTVFTKDDPLFDIIGIARSPDGATDVSTNKLKYLAEAYLPKQE
jgi:excisionase family DNA binding protein